MSCVYCGNTINVKLTDCNSGRFSSGQRMVCYICRKEKNLKVIDN